MATANSYDRWEDPGMAFTEEDLASYSLASVAEGRVEACLERWRLAMCRADVGETVKWWTHAGKLLIRNASWYCVVAGLPGLVTEGVSATLPTPQSKEGKALKQKALETEPGDWLAAWQSEAEAAVAHAVTLGRRCVPSWSKGEKKMSNRLCNALLNEVRSCEKLRGELLSMSA